MANKVIKILTTNLGKKTITVIKIVEAIKPDITLFI